MTGIEKAVAVLGGAAALAFALEFGGVGAGSPGNTTPPQPAASVVPSGAQAPGSGVHIHVATLAGCVSGLDC